MWVSGDVWEDSVRVLVLRAMWGAEPRIWLRLDRM